MGKRDRAYEAENFSANMRSRNNRNQGHRDYNVEERSPHMYWGNNFDEDGGRQQLRQRRSSADEQSNDRKPRPHGRQSNDNQTRPHQAHTRPAHHHRNQPAEVLGPEFNDVDEFFNIEDRIQPSRDGEDNGSSEPVHRPSRRTTKADHHRHVHHDYDTDHDDRRHSHHHQEHHRRHHRHDHDHEHHHDHRQQEHYRHHHRHDHSNHRDHREEKHHHHDDRHDYGRQLDHREEEHHHRNHRQYYGRQHDHHHQDYDMREHSLPPQFRHRQASPSPPPSTTYRKVTVIRRNSQGEMQRERHVRVQYIPRDEPTSRESSDSSTRWYSRYR